MSVTASRPIMYPMTSCRKVKLPVKATPGTLTKVRLLVSVETTEATFLMEADGPALAALLEKDRERLVLQNMLEEGNDQEAAERQVDSLLALLRVFGRGTLRIVDAPEVHRLRLDFALGCPRASQEK